MTQSVKASRRTGTRFKTFDPSFYTSFLRHFTEDEVSTAIPLSPLIKFNCVKNHDGKYYVAAMGRVNKGRDAFIYKFNAITNAIEQTFRIEVGIAASDIHRSPVIDIDSDGNIYVAMEELFATGSAREHGSPIRLYKTTVPYDISTLALRYTIANTSFSNPMLWVNGANVTIAARGINSTNFIRGDFWYYTSTDNGATFGSGTKVYDSGDEQKVAYIYKIYSHDGVEHMILNERDNDLSTWTFIAHFKRISGHTWGNADGSWTKNVSVSGAITRAEMIANCMVYNSTNYATINVLTQGGVVKSDGTVKLALSIGTATGAVFFGNPIIRTDELRLYTHNGSWSHNAFDLPFPQFATGTYVHYLNNDEEDYDEMSLIDYSGRKDGFIMSSDDSFATYETTKICQGNNRYLLGASAFNVDTSEEQLIVLSEHFGNFMEITNETAADHANLIFIKP